LTDYLRKRNAELVLEGWGVAEMMNPADLPVFDEVFAPRVDLALVPVVGLPLNGG
jgi:hypothetical protein